MGAMSSQITYFSVVCSIICSGADKWKHQSSASLASVRGIHRWTMDSLHKGPVTRKMFIFDEVFMNQGAALSRHYHATATTVQSIVNISMSNWTRFVQHTATPGNTTVTWASWFTNHRQLDRLFNHLFRLRYIKLFWGKNLPVIMVR